MRRPSFFPPYSLTIAQLTRNNNKRREVKPSSAPPTPIPCFTVIFCILFLLTIFFFQIIDPTPRLYHVKIKKEEVVGRKKKKNEVSQMSLFQSSLRKTRGVDVTPAIVSIYI